jgi:hypothetical protein
VAQFSVGGNRAPQKLRKMLLGLCEMHKRIVAISECALRKPWIERSRIHGASSRHLFSVVLLPEAADQSVGVPNSSPVYDICNFDPTTPKLVFAAFDINDDAYSRDGADCHHLRCHADQKSWAQPIPRANATIQL